MTQVNEVPAAAPVPNAALVDTLEVVRGNVRINRRKIVEQIGMAEQQLEVQRETLKQFDAMLATMDVALADPFNIQNIANAMLAVAAEAVEAPLPYADSTGGAEGSAGEDASASAEAGPVGTDANGSPVADNASDAS